MHTWSLCWYARMCAHKHVYMGACVCTVSVCVCARVSTCLCPPALRLRTARGRVGRGREEKGPDAECPSCLCSLGTGLCTLCI